MPPEFFTSSFDKTAAFEQQKTLREFRNEIETEYIRYCLDKFSGNVAKVSEFLEIDRTYMYKKLRKIGLRD